MRPTRRTQPYRKKSQRPPGPARDAMLRGRAPQLGNPMDVRRAAQKGLAGKMLRATGRRGRRR